MVKPYRLLCLEALLESLADMDATLPAPDPYGYEFSKISFGQLGEGNKLKRLVGGLVVGRETKSDLYPVVECNLPVIIDFRYLGDTSDSAIASVIAEEVLGAVQRRVFSDRTLGGLAIDVRETGNDLDIDFSEDMSIIGSMYIEIIYRHDHGDPRYYFGINGPVGNTGPSV